MATLAELSVQSCMVDDAISWSVQGCNYAVVANESECILSDPLVSFGDFQMPVRRFIDGRKVYRAAGYTVLHQHAQPVQVAARREPAHAD